MRRVFAAAIGLVFAIPAESAAHRLDEYLQAARVSFARDRITLDVDLTPGASIASAIVTILDRDGDHTISPSEAEQYGRSVLADLVLHLDERPVALTLTRVEAPSIDAMRDGLGTIRLRAVGSVRSVVAGRRHLDLRNNHLPASSAYLANALVPDDRSLEVVAQTRDPRQQALRVEYDVGPGWPAKLLWLAAGVAALSALIAFRRMAFFTGGLRPPAPLTRSLAGAPPAPLRSRGSLAALTRGGA
jgi:hypothetical protein